MIMEQRNSVLDFQSNRRSGFNCDCFGDVERALSVHRFHVLVSPNLETINDGFIYLGKSLIPLLSTESWRVTAMDRIYYQSTVVKGTHLGNSGLESLLISSVV